MIAGNQFRSVAVWHIRELIQTYIRRKVQPPAAQDVRGADIVRNTVNPRSQGTLLLENPHAPPQFNVNVLQQIAALIRVSLKATDQSLQCGAKRGDGLGIPIVLFHAPMSISLSSSHYL